MPVHAFIAQSGRSVARGASSCRPCSSTSSRRSISSRICGHSQQCWCWMRRSLMSSFRALNGPVAGAATSDPSLGPSVCSSDAGGVAIRSRCCACESCECRETPCAVGLYTCAQWCESCAWPKDSHRSQTMRKLEIPVAKPAFAGFAGFAWVIVREGSFLAKIRYGGCERGASIASGCKPRFAGFAVCTRRRRPVATMPRHMGADRMIWSVAGANLGAYPVRRFAPRAHKTAKSANSMLARGCGRLAAGIRKIGR